MHSSCGSHTSGMQHVVARLSDRNVQLLVGTNRDELPAVGLVLRQIGIDHGRLRRLVEIGLDIVDLGDLRQLGDVKRALVICETVRPIETLGNRLDFGLAILLDDGCDLVPQTRADKNRAFVAHAQRARVRYAARIDLNVETRWKLELGSRQLIRRCRQRRRRNRRELGSSRVSVGTADQR